MALEAQNNPFTSILMVGAADPEALATDADPAAGSYRLVMGTDDKLYILDEAGNAVEVGAAAGAVATDAIWDAAGDLVQGSGANTGVKLGAGLTGQMLRSAGAAAANAWAYPPGYEFDYVEATSGPTPTATTEATANTIVTANAVTYDGSTVIIVEYFCPFAAAPNSTGASMTYCLYDGAGSVGKIGIQYAPRAANDYFPIHLRYRITPSAAAHTYSIRAFVSTGTGQIGAGAGGNGANVPLYIRQVKA